MIDFNDYEWIVLGLAGVLLICMVLWSWLYGQGCCRNCVQGRRCKCGGSK